MSPTSLLKLSLLAGGWTAWGFFLVVSIKRCLATAFLAARAFIFRRCSCCVRISGVPGRGARSYLGREKAGFSAEAEVAATAFLVDGDDGEGCRRRLAGLRVGTESSSRLEREESSASLKRSWRFLELDLTVVSFFGMEEEGALCLLRVEAPSGFDLLSYL